MTENFQVVDGQLHFEHNKLSVVEEEFRPFIGGEWKMVSDVDQIASDSNPPNKTYFSKLSPRINIAYKYLFHSLSRATTWFRTSSANVPMSSSSVVLSL